MAVLTAIASSVAFVTPAGAATQGLTQISDDPFTSTNAPTGQHRTQVEPDTFAFGDTIVSAFQVGRITNGGATDIGWATSLDGGKSWTQGEMPSATVASTPPGPFFGGSDASVAFDARHHQWLVSWLGLHQAGGGAVDVVVSRSPDGLHWSAPVTITANNIFYDKNWTVCDNSPTSAFFGHCYTEFDNASRGDRELMSTSTDGGQTWSAELRPADGVHGLGGQPVVQPNGRVVVPFEGVDNEIRSFSSDDGGATWNASVLISSTNDHEVAGDIRTSPLPTAEISGDGTVYVAWQDARFEANGAANDIVLSTSTDGTTWSDVRRIPADALGSNVDHFIPGLAVDAGSSGAHTRLALTYYFYPDADCTAATCQLEVGYLTSVDAGQHWSKSLTLAGPMSLGSLAHTTQGVMVGDYISTSFATDERAVPAFAIGEAPTDGAAFQESTFTATEHVRGGPNPLGDDPVVFTGTGGGGGDDEGGGPDTGAGIRAVTPASTAF